MANPKKPKKPKKPRPASLLAPEQLLILHALIGDDVADQAARRAKRKLSRRKTRP